jgi:hypothetical protein
LIGTSPTLAVSLPTRPLRGGAGGGRNGPAVGGMGTRIVWSAEEETSTRWKGVVGAS